MIVVHTTPPEQSLQKIDFNEMIKQSIENVRHAEGMENMDIQINVTDQNEFRGNYKLLNIVFNSLISNGIKYRKITGDNSRLQLSVFTDNAKAIIHVEDNGRGIAPEEVDKVFNLFHRGSQSDLGGGMGLYMAKEIIEKLGGKITVESALNVGTAFTFEIPNTTFTQQKNSAGTDKKYFG